MKLEKECDETVANWKFRQRWMGKILRCEVMYDLELRLATLDRPNHKVKTVEGPVIAIQEVTSLIGRNSRSKRRPTGDVIIQAQPGPNGEETVNPKRCQVIG